jgi:histidinol-phosphate phosphatase family protein
VLRQAVIVAGGAGTRLRAAEPGRPKVLVQVGGEPLLAHHLRWLGRHGVEEVFVTAGHLADEVEAYLAASGPSPSRPRCTLVRESRPLGTAGALARLTSSLRQSFFVIYGDVLASVDLGRLGRVHGQRDGLATLVAHPNSHPHDSDLIETDGDDRVLRLIPARGRPTGDPANLVSAALYALEPSALRYVAPGIRQDFVRDVFPAMLAAGERLQAYRTPEYVKDMGTPERLAAVRRDVAAGVPEASSWDAPRATVFLDRDGTLNRWRGEILVAESLELVPGAAEAVRALNQAGVLAVLVTNQPMLAKGRLTLESLQRIHARLETLLGREGAYLDAIYYCPHHPERGFAGEVRELKIDCACRKPRAGLIRRALSELPIDAERAVVIGDSWRDTLAARAAGLPCIGLRGGEGFHGPAGECAPECRVDDLRQAVEIFLRQTGAAAPPPAYALAGEPR